MYSAPGEERAQYNILCNCTIQFNALSYNITQYNAAGESSRKRGGGREGEGGGGREGEGRGIPFGACLIAEEDQT